MMTSALVCSMFAFTLVARPALALPGGAEYRQAAQMPKPQPAAEPPAPAPPVPEPANIRLELTITITDPRGTPLLPPRTASIFVVDRDSARIRTGRMADSTPRPENVSMPPAPVLNLDAVVTVLPRARVRVGLGFEYRPGGPEADKMQPIHINERVSAILDDGKPLIVSQTADPASDRMVKVELKATILK
jgi:hypothetical protein